MTRKQQTLDQILEIMEHYEDFEKFLEAHEESIISDLHSQRKNRMYLEDYCREYELEKWMCRQLEDYIRKHSTRLKIRRTKKGTLIISKENFALLKYQQPPELAP